MSTNLLGPDYYEAMRRLDNFTRNSHYTVMVLLVFWLKIAVKLVVNLFKIFPIVVIGAVAAIYVFVFTKKEHLISMTPEIFITTILILCVIALVVSTKKYDVIPKLTLYAKSNNSNSTTEKLFFLKQALINNMPIFVFDIFVWKRFVKTDFSWYLPPVTIFSILCALGVLIVKNKYNDNKMYKTKKATIRINPLLKSTVYDYCTPGFIQEMLLCVVLFIALLLKLVKNVNFVNKAEYPSVFYIEMLAVIMIGFIGILDSIPHTNWEFYSIIAPSKFSFHFKKTLIFIVILFCPILLAFIYIILHFSQAAFRDSIKYLYIGMVLLFISITTAFSKKSMLIKVNGIILISIFIFWLSGVNDLLLLLLIIPVIIIFSKVKIEYIKWYLL